MTTDLVRDHAFTIAWFGLMTMVWLGWAQESPPQWARLLLGLGSMVGLGLAGYFGFVAGRAWHTPSALDGRYVWFGVFVLLEVLAAAIGCLVLAGRGQARWFAWWVALVVAFHFLPLAWFLDDWSIALLGGLQLVLLGLLYRPLVSATGTTSFLVGATMGVTLLAFAAISAIVYLAR